jgi:hypothetical protein
MDPEAFKKVWVTILKLGLVPWVVEAAVNCGMHEIHTNCV